MKKLAAGVLVLIVLLVVASFFVRQSRHDAPVLLGAATGPAYAVRVWKPVMSARPIWDVPAAMFGFTDNEMRFDHTTAGARVDKVGPTRLELNADGWQFVVVATTDGRIAPGTTAMFPLDPTNTRRGARCTVETNTEGYLRTATRTGTQELDGEFRVDFTDCEYVNTGRGTGWMGLTVRGSFAGLAPR